jgi:hypothetical protein
VSSSLPHAALRLATLALVAAVTVSACSTVSTGLALVPGTPPPPGPTTVGRDATSPPSPSPAARAAAQKAEPDADPAARRKPDADPAARKGPDADPAARRKPKVTVRKLRPRPAPGPFRMNLYRKGDFVHQGTKDWCVAGSTLTMMNIIDDGKPRNSVAAQKRLYDRGRKLSPVKRKLGPIGVDLIGWAELLNTRGYGPYEVTPAETRRGAIRRAARAIRRTGRPVGLVTWRGAHSWVMSGFTATADPAYDKDFQVKAAYIQDTWYPWVSTIWGASRPPNSLVPVAKLAEDYLPYARPRAKWPRRDGNYMLILPVLPEGTVAR